MATAVCPWCHKVVPLRRDGTLEEHVSGGYTKGDKWVPVRCRSKSITVVKTKRRSA